MYFKYIKIGPDESCNIINSCRTSYYCKNDNQFFDYKCYNFDDMPTHIRTPPCIYINILATAYCRDYLSYYKSNEDIECDYYTDSENCGNYLKCNDYKSCVSTPYNCYTHVFLKYLDNMPI